MMLNIGIRDLKLIRLIAESGSITAAARRMHVSQPAASQRLANLQSNLDADLFIRVDGVMCATPVGDRIVAAARAVSGELESTKFDIQALLAARDSRLRVTTECYTCYRWLPFVIREMHALHPGLTIDVVPEATDTPYEALSGDKIDIAIVSNARPDTPFDSRNLFGDELYAVMSTENALAARTFLTPAGISVR